MSKPKTFSRDDAQGEAFEADGEAKVIVYRFGNKGNNRDWESRRRQKAKGNFTRPSDTELNDWAIKQTSYGNKSENSENNPFLSVATNCKSLWDRNEGWVRKIIEEAPDVGKFSVPFHRLLRSKPTKPVSKQETEWCYYDGDEALKGWLVDWLSNEYKKKS